MRVLGLYELLVFMQRIIAEHHEVSIRGDNGDIL